MKILQSAQREPISDAVRAKFAMVAPILEATLFSVQRERLERLGGIHKWSLVDLAREHREGDGDTGICFEYAVHDAIARRDRLMWPLVSEVLGAYCGIRDGADSLLFGPEKEGVIPILSSVGDALSDDSRLYVGNRGQPLKLKRYIPQIIRAFRRSEVRNELPRSIRGLWKADLFLGNKGAEKWVGTTIKVNASDLEGARGLRIGIYPMRTKKESPRLDEDLNLVRLPLPYDAHFMDLFYKSFHLVRAFLLVDAQVPPPVRLPDAEDRYVTKELQDRRAFPLLEVLSVLRDMSQAGLLYTEKKDVSPDASLSEAEGLNGPSSEQPSDYVSLTPIAQER